jgi:hypothetical protein
MAYFSIVSLEPLRIWAFIIGAIFAIIYLKVSGDMKIANTDDGKLPNGQEHQSQLANVECCIGWGF